MRLLRLQRLHADRPASAGRFRMGRPDDVRIGDVARLRRVEASGG